MDIHIACVVNIHDNQGPHKQQIRSDFKTPHVSEEIQSFLLECLVKNLMALLGEEYPPDGLHLRHQLFWTDLVPSDALEEFRNLGNSGLSVVIHPTNQGKEHLQLAFSNVQRVFGKQLGDLLQRDVTKMLRFRDFYEVFADVLVDAVLQFFHALFLCDGVVEDGILRLEVLKILFANPRDHVDAKMLGACVQLAHGIVTDFYICGVDKIKQSQDCVKVEGCQV